jgi:hypothetical protein
MKTQTLSMHKVARNVLERIAKRLLRRKGWKEKRTEIVADALARVFTPEALSSIGNVGFYFVPFHDALLQPSDTNGELSKALIEAGCVKANSEDMNLYRIFRLCKRELENAKKMRDRKDKRVIEESRDHDVQQLLTHPSETPLAGIKREEREKVEEARLETEEKEKTELRRALLDLYHSFNTPRERETLLQLINTDLSNREINVRTGMARPNISKLRKKLYAMGERYLTDDPSDQPVYEASEFQLFIDNQCGPNENAEALQLPNGGTITQAPVYGLEDSVGDELEAEKKGSRGDSADSANNIRGPSASDYAIFGQFAGGDLCGHTAPATGAYGYAFDGFDAVHKGSTLKELAANPIKHARRSSTPSGGKRAREERKALLRAGAADSEAKCLRLIAEQKRQEYRAAVDAAKQAERWARIEKLNITSEELRELQFKCDQEGWDFDKIVSGLIERCTDIVLSKL